MLEVAIVIIGIVLPIALFIPSQLRERRKYDDVLKPDE